ncbi:MAG: cupin domain-containing protein [Gammaproteobacteria bacterium]
MAGREFERLVRLGYGWDRSSATSQGPTRMQRIQTASHDTNAPYRAPHCNADGPVTGSFAAMGAIWVMRADLGPGAALSWAPEHGDEVLYLIEGSVRLDGRTVSPGDAVFLEAGANAHLAAEVPSRIVQFGSFEPAPRLATDGADAQPGEKKIVPPQGAAGKVATGPDGTVYKTRYYADGTQPGCRAALLRVEIDASARVPPHSHSAHEIIHVLNGRIRLGAQTVSAGMSLSVAGNTRYAFETEGPIDFINYRPEVSYITSSTPGSNPKPVLETPRGISEGYDH